MKNSPNLARTCQESLAAQARLEAAESLVISPEATRDEAVAAFLQRVVDADFNASPDLRDALDSFADSRAERPAWETPPGWNGLRELIDVETRRLADGFFEVPVPERYERLMRLLAMAAEQPSLKARLSHLRVGAAIDRAALDALSEPGPAGDLARTLGEACLELFLLAPGRGPLGADNCLANTHTTQSSGIPR